MISVSTTDFNDSAPSRLSTFKYGTDWPVVYIIDNRKDEAYVGETLDASVRATQHLQNPERRRLTEISLISNDEFNKSVILHLESYLIRHMTADGTFRLQNANNGIHHNYYHKEYYEHQFREIWEELLKQKLAQKSLEEIENSDLYKYSPYTSLSPDQCATEAAIIKAIAEAGDYMPLTCVVEGGPGTGKTVLAVHLMKLLNGHKAEEQDTEPEEEESLASIAEDLKRISPSLKVGFVVPMQSLRTTLRNVFSQMHGLSRDMVVSPEELTKSTKTYDLLVVDEAHRLRRYYGLQNYKTFKEANQRMGLDPEKGTELDWIKGRSRMQILFYDGRQSVKPADIPRNIFTGVLHEDAVKKFRLHTQFRCKGGDEYIEYVRRVLSDHPPEKKLDTKEYDVKLYTDCGQMTDTIRALNEQFGLCRNVAGYAWEWVAKNNPELYDIKIGNRQYRWNTESTDWVNSPNSINEIGCIHTIQGYDLNYCGIIFGWEIDYDPVRKCFTVDKSKYKDRHGKEVGDDIGLLKDYILNIYSTLMTRGIMGTYVYACNQNLQEYLKKYFDTV